MRALVVSLHDVHPGSRERIATQRKALSAWGVPRRSLLVVPEFHHGPPADEPGHATWLRECRDQGDEIVLHGYFHDRKGQGESLRNLFWTRFYTNREAEFLDLPPNEARARIERGHNRLVAAGLAPSGFIAPAWLMAPGLPALLAEMGFGYTNTLGTFLDLARNRTIATQSLCWSTRSAWRRTVSLGWNRLLFRRLRGKSLLRVSLHPDDLAYVAIRKQIERIVKTALDAGYEPITYADHVAG